MADTTRADTFARALQAMEQSGDPADLLSQFSSDAELTRPELEHSQGPTTDADSFWSAYRDQFSEISTQFTHVAEAEDIAVLEWHSKATLATGRSIEYAGVSLLTFGDDDTVSRFSTYYDTAAFVSPTS